MMSQDSHYCIYWEKTDQDNAKILRIFGESPAVTVPAHIAGYPVTELGNYCFAPASRLPAEGYLIQDAGRDSRNTAAYADTRRELCGNYIECVTLPDSLVKIGDYTFYDCRNLTQLEFGNSLTTIGSDAFMNCCQLHYLSLRCGPSEKSGLRRILCQIPWEVEVSFVEHTHFSDSCNVKVKAAILYPEYYETYDEIAPAHIFGRNIAGEGFRARQSFKDNMIDFSQYDTIFQKTCAEEPEQTVCRLALCRLRYPIGLSVDQKNQYQTYIKMHGKTLCRSLVTAKDLEALSDIFQQQLLSPADTQYAIQLAAEAGWSEGSASMLRWKQQYTKIPAHKKYEFDDFW